MHAAGKNCKKGVIYYMVRIVKMFKHDWLEGIWHRKLYLILPVLAAFFSCAGIHSSIRDYQKIGNISNGTFMDYWIYLVDGCEAYKFDWYNSFVIPIRWICFLVFLLIGVNNYMLSDLRGWGYQVLVHSKSRLNWWVSKIMWCISYTLCYFFILMCTVLFYCLSKNISINFTPTSDIMKMQASREFMKFGSLELYMAVILLPLLMAVFLSLVQMVLSLYIRPVYVFIVMFIWLVASAYKKSWLLVGNLGMPYRMRPVLENGFRTSQCVIVLICISLLCIVWGYLKFRKRDVLEKV